MDANQNQVEMKPSEVLKKAKELFNTYRWIQGHLATTKSGESCGLEDKDVACFCVHGAIMKVVPLKDTVNKNVERHAKDYYIKACNPILYPRIMDFNDTPGRTKEEIMNKFNEAIAFAESEGN